jgi:hypothetical protein
MLMLTLQLLGMPKVVITRTPHQNAYPQHVSRVRYQKIISIVQVHVHGPARAMLPTFQSLLRGIVKS